MPSLLRLQKSAYEAMERNRGKIEGVAEQPIRTRYSSRSGTRNPSGSPKHNNMIEETIEVLIDEGVLDPYQDIYKGSRQIKLNALGEEVPASWSGDTRAYRMPDITGYSLSGAIINVNVCFRNTLAYEQGALTGIMNADTGAAFALFVFGGHP